MRYQRLAPLLFSALLVAVAAIARANPRLTIKEPYFNFGFAPQHSELSHTFVLHSTGEDSLKILNVIPGCGCTKAPLKKDVLAVGDSTELEVIFSTRTYRNQVSKRPIIKTNEGPPDKHVQFVATVVSRPDSTYPLIITPYKIDLSQYGEKELSEIEFAIQNVSDSDLKLTIISSAPDYFDFKLPQSVAAGKIARCKIHLTPAGLTDSFTKSFTLEVNDADTSRFTVPVKRTIVGSGDTAAPESEQH